MRTHPDIDLVIADLPQLARFLLCLSNLNAHLNYSQQETLSWFFILGHITFHAIQHHSGGEILSAKFSGQRRDVQDTSNNQIQSLPSPATRQVPGADT
jgi:hypothetical protein